MGDPESYQKLAEDLLIESKVKIILGCYTSRQRNHILWRRAKPEQSFLGAPTFSIIFLRAYTSLDRTMYGRENREE